MSASATGTSAALGASSLLPNITESLRASFIPLLASLEKMKTPAAHTYMLELLFTLARLDASLQEEERRLFVCAYDALIAELVQRRRVIAEKKRLLAECYAFLTGLRERCGVLQDVCEARVVAVRALEQHGQQEALSRVMSPAQVSTAETAGRDGSAAAPDPLPEPSLSPWQRTLRYPLLVPPATTTDRAEGVSETSFSLISPLPNATTAGSSSSRSNTSNGVIDAKPPLSSRTLGTPVTFGEVTDAHVMMTNASFTSRNPQSCSALQSVLRENFKRKLQQGTSRGGSGAPANTTTTTPPDLSLQPNAGGQHEDAEPSSATIPSTVDASARATPATATRGAGGGDSGRTFASHSPLSASWSLPGNLSTLAQATSNAHVAAAVRTAAAAAGGAETGATAAETPLPAPLRSRSPGRRYDSTGGAAAAEPAASSSTRSSRHRQRQHRPPSLFGPAQRNVQITVAGTSASASPSGSSSMLAPITASAALAALSSDNVCQLGGTSTTRPALPCTELSSPVSNSAIGMAEVWEEVFWSFLTGAVGVADMQALLALLIAGSPARLDAVARDALMCRTAASLQSPHPPHFDRRNSHRRGTATPPSSTRTQALSAAELCVQRLQTSLCINSSNSTTLIRKSHDNEEEEEDQASALAGLHWDFWVAIQTSLVVLLEGLLFGTEADPTAITTTARTKRSGEEDGAGVGQGGSGDDGGELPDRAGFSSTSQLRADTTTTTAQTDAGTDEASGLRRALPLPSPAALVALQTLCPSLRSYSAGLAAVTQLAPAIATRTSEEAMRTLQQQQQQQQQRLKTSQSVHMSAEFGEDSNESSSRAENVMMDGDASQVDEAGVMTSGGGGRLSAPVSASGTTTAAALGFTSDATRLSRCASSSTVCTNAALDLRHSQAMGTANPAGLAGGGEHHNKSNPTHGAAGERDRDGAARRRAMTGTNSDRNKAGRTTAATSSLPPLPETSLTPADVILHFFVSALSWEVVLTEYARHQEAALRRYASAADATLDDDDNDNDLAVTDANSLYTTSFTPAVASASDLTAGLEDGNEKGTTVGVVEGDRAVNRPPAQAVIDGEAGERAQASLNASGAWAAGGNMHLSHNTSSNNRQQQANLLGTAAAAGQLLNFSFASAQSTAGPIAATPISTPAGQGGAFPAMPLPSSFFFSRQSTASDGDVLPESFYSYIAALGGGASAVDRLPRGVSPHLSQSQQQQQQQQRVTPTSFTQSVAATLTRGGGGWGDEFASPDEGGEDGSAANVSFASTTLAVANQMRRLVEQHLQTIKLDDSFAGRSSVGAAGMEEEQDDDDDGEGTGRGSGGGGAAGTSATRSRAPAGGAPPASSPWSAHQDHHDGLVGVVIPAVMAAELDDLVTRVGDALTSLEHMESQVCGEMTLITFRVVSTLLDWLIPAVYVADRRTWLFYRKWVCDAYRVLLEENLLERFADMLDPTQHGVDSEWTRALEAWNGMPGGAPHGGYDGEEEEEAATPPEPSTTPTTGALPGPIALAPSLLPPPTMTTSAGPVGAKAKRSRSGMSKTTRTRSPKPGSGAASLAASLRSDVDEPQKDTTASGETQTATAAPREAESRARTSSLPVTPSLTPAQQQARQLAELRSDPRALVVPGCAVDVVRSMFRPAKGHGESVGSLTRYVAAAAAHKPRAGFGADLAASPGLGAARALLDQGTRLLPPRHFLLTRLIAATVRGLDEDVIVYLLASLFTPRARHVVAAHDRVALLHHQQRQQSHREGSADDHNEEDSVDGDDDSRSGVSSRGRPTSSVHSESRRHTHTPAASAGSHGQLRASQSVIQTPVKAGPDHGAGELDDPFHQRSDNLPLAERSHTAYPMHDVENRNVSSGRGGRGVRAQQHTSARVRSHSTGALSAARRGQPGHSNHADAHNSPATNATPTNTSSAVDVPALVHHHRFRYPSVKTPVDVHALYQEALEDAEVNLSPHDPVRAAIVLNAADFFICQGQLHDALTLIETYLADVDEERVQLPRLATVSAASVVDSLAATTTTSTSGSATGGNAFSVTSVRGVRGGGQHLPGSPPSPPAPSAQNRASMGVAGDAGGGDAAGPGRRGQSIKAATTSTVSVPSAELLAASEAGGAAPERGSSTVAGEVVRVPALIPSWGTQLEKDQFLQLLVLLKGVEEDLQAHVSMML